MPLKNETTAGTLKFNPHFSDQMSMNSSFFSEPHSFYKSTLFLSDIFLSVLIFWGCAHVFSDGTKAIAGFAGILTVMLFALAAIAFFHASKLYSYHVIYDLKRHTKQMVLAWVWGALILFSAFFIYNYGHSFTDFQFVISTVAVAALFLILKKYLEDYSFQILTAIGVSFIVVGWLGLLGTDATGALPRTPAALVPGFFFSVIAVSLSRYLIVHQLFRKILKKSFRRQTVIVGSDEQAEKISQFIISKDAPFWITGVVGMSSNFGKKLSVTKQNLGDVINLPKIVEKNRISEVIVTDESIDKKTLIAILDYCASNRINVWFPPNYMPVISVKLYIDQFCELPMIRLGTQKNSWIFGKLKYAFDAVATLPIFLLQLPFFLAIAVAVKLTSKGPVFYRATAIGKGGRTFRMYKFRSMREGSDSSVHKDYVTKLIKGDIKSDCNGTAVTKMTDDDRITNVGKIIRKFSLDELPQLLNVLKGDMSLIGPRPCLPYEYEAYDEWHKKRAAVRPGVSGLWQVTGRSEVSFEDMILLDLYYIYNRSFSLDLSILFETLFVVIHKKGAY